MSAQPGKLNPGVCEGLNEPIRSRLESLPPRGSQPVRVRAGPVWPARLARAIRASAATRPSLASSASPLRPLPCSQQASSPAPCWSSPLPLLSSFFSTTGPEPVTGPAPACNGADSKGPPAAGSSSTSGRDDISPRCADPSARRIGVTTNASRGMFVRPLVDFGTAVIHSEGHTTCASSSTTRPHRHPRTGCTSPQPLARAACHPGSEVPSRSWCASMWSGQKNIADQASRHSNDHCSKRASTLGRQSGTMSPARRLG